MGEVPVPTIKYYLREGLLARGRHTAPNQAEYDETHVRRLRLIRVLVEVGGVGLASVRTVLHALDDEELPLHELLGVAQRALAEGDESKPAGKFQEIDEFLEELGWQVSPTAPARAELGSALDALRRLGWNVTTDSFRPYARAAFDIAKREVKVVSAEISRSETVERLVVGTVVFERILAAFRRLAQEHHSSILFNS